MPDYVVFGGCLRSSLTIPELESCVGMAPDWTLEIRSDCAPLNGAAQLGEDIVFDDVSVRLYRLAAGFRLEQPHGDTADDRVADALEADRGLPSETCPGRHEV